MLNKYLIFNLNYTPLISEPKLLQLPSAATNSQPLEEHKKQVIYLILSKNCQRKGTERTEGDSETQWAMERQESR